MVKYIFRQEVDPGRCEGEYPSEVEVCIKDAETIEAWELQNYFEAFLRACGYTPECDGEDKA